MKGSEPGSPMLDKRTNGIYYTPAEVSKALSEWAIASPEDRVLDPSFGGCCFLVSSHDRLRFLGARNPSAALFGCDTDPAAFEALRDKQDPRAEIAAI